MASLENQNCANCIGTPSFQLSKTAMPPAQTSTKHLWTSGLHPVVNVLCCYSSENCGKNIRCSRQVLENGCGYNILSPAAYGRRCRKCDFISDCDDFNHTH